MSKSTSRDAVLIDDGLRLKVVRKMYAMRFGEEPPTRRSGIPHARGDEPDKKMKSRIQVLRSPRQWGLSEDRNVQYRERL